MKNLIKYLLFVSIFGGSCVNPNNVEKSQYLYTGKIRGENAYIGNCDVTNYNKVMVVFDSITDTAYRDTEYTNTYNLTNFLYQNTHEQFFKKIVAIDTLNQVAMREISSNAFARISWDKPLKNSTWNAEISFTVTPSPDSIYTTYNMAPLTWSEYFVDVQIGVDVFDTTLVLADSVLIRNELKTSLYYDYVLKFTKIDN